MEDFVTLAESIITRYQTGGFLTGDLVKLKESAMKSEWMSKQASHFVERVQEMIDSGLNLRISAVKALRPSALGTVQSGSQVDDFYCDVIRERAPGLLMDFITLPAFLLELANPDGPNLAPIPDALIKKDKSHIKPEEGDHQLPTSDTKMPNGNKWNDKKPGGGNTPSKLMESYIDSLNNPTQLNVC